MLFPSVLTRRQFAEANRREVVPSTPRQKRLTVFMDEDVHRSFKATAGSVDLSESTILVRTYLLATKLATDRSIAIITNGDKNVLTFGEVLEVIIHNNAQAREVFTSVDDFATWMRRAAVLITAFANGTPEDFPVLRRQARKLAKETPWNDPRPGGIPS